MVRRGVCILEPTLEKPDITVQVLLMIWMDRLFVAVIAFAGEQQSVERGVGKAENCTCCQSHWRNQVKQLIIA